MQNQPSLKGRLSFVLKKQVLSLTILLLTMTLLFSACGEATTTKVSVDTGSLKTLPTADLGSVATGSTTPVAGSSVTSSPSSNSAVANTGTAANPIIMRISYPGDITTPNGKLVTHFADEVAQRTAGRVVIKSYPNSTASGGDQLTALNMVQGNKIEAVATQASIFTTIDPPMEILGYPFLFANRSNTQHFIESDSGKQLFNSLEQFNFETLVIGDQGFRQLSNSKRAVNSPSDLESLRIRIPQSNLYTKVFKALGAEPVTMNYSPELYKALQNKSLDGQDAPIGFSNANKYYEIQPYLTLLNYSWDPILLTINQTFWKTLPADLQTALTEAGKQTTQFINNSIDQDEKAVLDKYSKLGIQITTLSSEQQKAFIAATKPIYAAAEQQFGKDFMSNILKAAQTQ